MAFEIAVGIWMGGLLLIGTIWAGIEVTNRIKRKIHSSQVTGYPWMGRVWR